MGVKLECRRPKYGFVALGPANHVAVIDAKTFEISYYLLVGRRVWQMAIHPGSKAAAGPPTASAATSR